MGNLLGAVAQMVVGGGLDYLITKANIPGVRGLPGKLKLELARDVAELARDGVANAVGVLNLDSEPTTEATDAMMCIDEVDKIQFIELPDAGSLPTWLQ